VNDEDDQCPTQAGPAGNHGCPVIEPEAPKRKIFEAPTVQFQSSSSQLTTGSAPALQALADTLKTNADLELTIEGHTDISGRPDANLRLSLQRALAVKKALLALGVEESRISVKGLGDTQPVGDNRTEEGKRQNRRVVFVLRQKNS
jgi:outer membrane protein OmpA-like peptidoglycan-associated protein